MPRPAVLAALVLAAVALGLGAALLLREPGGTSSVAEPATAGATQARTRGHGAPDAPATRLGETRGSARDEAEGAPDEYDEGADEASDASGLDPAAIAAREDALGLPPLDLTERTDAEECEALATDKRRLNTSENMLAVMPAKNRDTEGAERLRAMRDRLEREVARRTTLLAKRGAKCPDG